MKVALGISNHHVHVTREHLNILYGENYELAPKKPLNQIGQYASEETVTIKTQKGEMNNIRILGPVRPYTQVEISKTDAIKLGLNPPLRESGDVKNSSPITIIGPKGTVELTEGCIIATRHIHITPEEAKEKGLENIKEVQVKIDGPKGGIMDHVSVKIAPNSYYEMHIDTDDANAHFLSNNDEVEIIIPENGN